MQDITPRLALFTSAPHDPTLEIPYGYCQCGCGKSTAISTTNHTKEGRIKGQPVRFVRFHHSRAKVARAMADRFWEKVNKSSPDGCWLWTGGLDRKGYGKIGIGDRNNRKTAQAHRIAWELTNGPIPDGYEACHNCPSGDNPRCVNPAHLWLGTQADNMADMAKKGRSTRGTRNPQAKITDNDVVEIRRLLADGVRVKDVATRFGMCYESIRMIGNRISWKHVK